MTMNTLDLDGSDVFKAMFDLHTDDLGKTWTEPRQRQTLAPRMEVIDGVERPVSASDFWPTWHTASNTLLGTGHSIAYTPDWKVVANRPRHTVYATFDATSDTWSSWQKLSMPEGPKFAKAGAGCTQRVDEPDGTILLPFYFQPPDSNSQVAVMRCAFDGRKLSYLEHGNELRVERRDTRNWRTLVGHTSGALLPDDSAQRTCLRHRTATTVCISSRCKAGSSMTAATWEATTPRHIG